MHRWILVGYSLFSGIAVSAQSTLFTKGPTIEIPGIINSTVSSGDYDNDGDADVLLAGTQFNIPYVKLFQYNNGKLEAVNNSGLPEMGGSAKWLNIDNDHDLDVLISTSSPLGSSATVYVNTNGHFAPVPTALPNLAWASYWPGDYDNDGDDDMLMFGTIDSSNGLARLYNNQGGSFTQVSSNITAGLEATASWVDFDKDGDLDLYSSGSAVEGGRLYENKGGQLVATSTNFPATIRGNVSWADADGDNDIDLLLAGANLSGGAGKIYLKDGNSYSAFQGLTLVPTEQGNSQFLDFDKDGDMDVFHSGFGSSGYVIQLYEKQSAGYVQVDNLGLPSQFARFHFLDYDNDNDLDALVPADGFLTRIYWNNTNSPVTPVDATPGWPVGLTTHPVDPNSIQLEFRDYADNEDVIYIEMRSGDNASFQVLTLLPASSQQTSKYTAALLSSGTRYAFRARSKNSSGYSRYSDTVYSYTATANLSYTLLTSPDLNTLATSFVDLDGDNDLDIVYGGYTYVSSTLGSVINLSKNTGGVFTNQANPITTIAPYSMDWSDFDSDGDMDLLVSGMPPGPGIAMTKLYVNQGNFSLTESPLDIQGIRDGFANWVDVNKDGHDDIYVSGTVDNDSRVHLNQLLINKGDNTFTEKTNIGIPAFYQARAVWDDFDADGIVDLAVTGLKDTLTYLIKDGSYVYLGRGDGSFKLSQTLQPTSWGTPTIASGDVDSDGDSDLVLGGLGHPTRIYKNNSGKFTADAATLPAFVDVSLSLADVDNDGDLDLIAGGYGKFYSTRNDIFLNDGGGTFTVSYYPLTGSPAPFYQFADIDGDSDLDFVEHFETGKLKLWSNLSAQPNVKPNMPTILETTQVADGIKIKWSKSDDKTNPKALTSNVYLKNPAGKVTYNRISALATGRLKTPKKGNAFQSDSFLFKNLDPGSYELGVQSIDNSFLASEFAVASFQVIMAPPVLTSDTTACEETSKVITVQGSNIAWFKDSPLTQSAGSGNAITVQVKKTDTTLYAVQKYGTVNGPPLKVRIKVFAKPAGTISKTANGLLAPLGATYKWYRNDTLLTASTAREIATSLVGVYKVTVQNGPCPTLTTSTFVLRPAAPGVTPATPQICVGQSQSVTATGKNIQWYSASGTKLGTAGPVISISSVGLADSVLFATQTVNLAESEKKKASWKVYAFPGNQLTLQGNQLQAAAGLQYKWYLDDELLVTETKRELMPAKEGVYYAVVSNGTCQTTSIKVTFVGIEEATREVVVYYLGSSQSLVVDAGTRSIESVAVYDIAGRCVLRPSDNPYSAGNTAFDLSHAGTGILIAHVITSDKQIHKIKFLKN